MAQRENTFNIGDRVLIVQGHAGWGSARSFREDEVKKVHAGNGNVTLKHSDTKFRQNGSSVNPYTRFDRTNLEPFSDELVAEIRAEREVIAIRNKVQSLGDLMRKVRDFDEAKAIWEQLPLRLRDMVEPDKRKKQG